MVGEDMDSRVFLIMSLLGFALMIVGFAGYVADPKTMYQAVFVVGVVALAVGYAFSLLSARLIRDDVSDE